MNRCLVLKLPRIQSVFLTASRLCVYLYSIVFFLRAIISFPPRLDGFLRMGIALFGYAAYFASGHMNIRRIRLSQYFLWYFGILVLSLVSSLYSINSNTMGFTSNIWDILLIGIGFSVSISDRESIKRYLLFFSMCGGVIFLALMSKNLLYIDDRLGRSLTGDNTNAFAMYLMLTLFAAISTFYLNEKISIKFLSVIVSLLDLYMLMLSGGRKYVIVPMILITAISILETSGAKNIFKRVAIISIIALGVVVGWNYMITNPVLFNSIGRRFINRVSVDNRELYILKGFEFFLSSPIWGHGENSFSMLIIPYHGSQIYSHNNYIELLTNFGIIGFTWFYFFFGKTLKINLKDAITTKDKLSILASSLMISMLVLDFGIISYSDSSLLFTFWVLCFNVAYTIIPREQQERFKGESVNPLREVN